MTSGITTPPGISLRLWLAGMLAETIAKPGIQASSSSSPEGVLKVPGFLP